MIPRLSRFVAALSAVGLMAAIFAAGASASYHLTMVRAVFKGVSQSSAFIELQMYADGQNLVSGHSLTVYDQDGTGFLTYTPLVDVPNGLDQRTILLRDFASSSPADFKVSGLGEYLSNPAHAGSGGAACWDTVDCFSWGSFTGDAHLPSPAGTPLAGGLLTTRVAARSIGRGCPTALDPADDSNNSNADFTDVVGFPVRTNSVAPSETQCPTSTPPGTGTGTTAKKKRCKKRKKRKKHQALTAKKRKCKKRKHR